MKRIMFLGGAEHQVSVLKYAKQRGYYTILCDYIEDNLGRLYADEFHCVSTQNQEAILELAKQKKIHGIVAYAADSALGTAAYVAHKLNLRFYSPSTISVLSNKNVFRKFLKDNGFNYPKSKSFTSFTHIKKELKDFQYPLVVKPIDAGGSRGIESIDDISELKRVFDRAMAISLQKTVIIEEFIEMATEYTVGGDVIILDGKIQYFGMLNGRRDVQHNRCIPIGNSYPTVLNDEKSLRVQNAIQKVIDLLNIQEGAFNIDVIFDKDDQLYIIEINPRNGANFVSELLGKATSINLEEIAVEMAINNITTEIKEEPNGKCYATYYLRSYEKGKLDQIIFDEHIQLNIIRKKIYKNSGDEVEVFDGLDKLIGILLLEFNDMNEMENKMKQIEKYIDLKIVSCEQGYDYTMFAKCNKTLLF